MSTVADWGHFDGDGVAAGHHLENVLGAPHDFADHEPVAGIGLRVDPDRGSHYVTFGLLAVDDDEVADPLLAEDLALAPVHEHRFVEQAGRVTSMAAHRLDGRVVQPDVSKRLGEEAGVEQMHGGVLGPAGVDVDREPVGGLLRIERLLVVVG